jgi:hypothetical protein
LPTRIDMIAGRKFTARFKAAIRQMLRAEKLEPTGDLVIKPFVDEFVKILTPENTHEQILHLLKIAIVLGAMEGG